MTTVADGNESGQSLLEFLFMLPLLFGTSVLLMRMNTAIQMSIVNQKYARAQTLFIVHNSPWYPKVGTRETELFGKRTNQMILGVSENNSRTDEDAGTTYVPEASTYRITRSPAASNGASNSDDDKEPRLRAEVRIRNTISLCAPSIYIQGRGGDFVKFDGDTPEIRNASAFLYCRSEYAELGGLQ